MRVSCCMYDKSLNLCTIPLGPPNCISWGFPPSPFTDWELGTERVTVVSYLARTHPTPHPLRHPFHSIPSHLTSTLPLPPFDHIWKFCRLHLSTLPQPSSKEWLWQHLSLVLNWWTSLHQRGLSDFPFSAKLHCVSPTCYSLSGVIY